MKDTWIYRSTELGFGTWTYAGDMPTALGPPAERSGASLTFDANSQKLVMIAGATFKNSGARIGSLRERLVARGSQRFESFRGERE